MPGAPEVKDAVEVKEGLKAGTGFAGGGGRGGSDAFAGVFKVKEVVVWGLRPGGGG